MEVVNVSFKVFWRFKDHHHLKVTKCKKIINGKTGAILKQQPRGYFIGKKYIKRSELKLHLEKIPKEQYLPF